VRIDKRGDEEKRLVALLLEKCFAKPGDFEITAAAGLR